MHRIVQFALNVILDPWNTFSSVFAHSIIAVSDPLVTNIKLKVPRSAVGWTFYSKMLTLSRRTCRLFALIFFNLFIFRMTRFFSHFIPNFKYSGMSCITFSSFKHISHGFFLNHLLASLSFSYALNWRHATERYWI